MAKSDKLYNKSPKIERDSESGKVGIKKPTKADAEDMGIEGNELPGAGDGMPVITHEEAMDAMHDRHINEMKDMHKRHAKEVSEFMKKSIANKEDTGEEEINEVEKED